MKTTDPSLVVLCLWSLLPAGAQPYSAWLPPSGQCVVTPAYTYQTFDEFWAGRTKVNLKPDSEWQHTALVGFEYGLLPSLAFDLTLGYTWSRTDSPLLTTPAGDSDDGLADTTFGLRWQFVDEYQTTCPFAPSMALRLGGIVKGTYDEDFPFSAGDGASGFETSLLLGKAICPGFGLYGDVGWRIRTEDVPEDLFGAAGLYLTWKFATLNVGYRGVKGLSGPDIGGPGFLVTYGFPQTKEISQNIETALGITDKGGRYYQFFYAHTLDGRNTGQKNVFGAAIRFPFGTK